MRNVSELHSEAKELRRALGWDALILAREWLDLCVAGDSLYGPVPQEVRTWIVDGQPFAWSFHHLHAVREPKGFPPSQLDLRQIATYCELIGKAFRSRLVVADFVRLTSGDWRFLEAGPGSCAGTAHEAVFKAVAQRLLGSKVMPAADAVGGPLRFVHD